MTAKSVLLRPKACAPGRVPPLAPLATPLIPSKGRPTPCPPVFYGYAYTSKSTSFYVVIMCKNCRKAVYLEKCVAKAA